MSAIDPAQPIRALPDLRSPGAGMTLNDSVYDRLLRERIIFLGQPVDDPIANRICAQLLLLAAEDPKRDIHLYINSPGGSVTAGMAIYDTMQFVERDVATFAMGLAASMGQFLLSRRHAGQALRAAARADPHAPAVRRHRRHRVGHRDPGRADASYTKREMAELIAQHTGQTVEQIEARLRPRPLVHRRSRPRTTASSTRSSSGCRRSRARRARRRRT